MVVGEGSVTFGAESPIPDAALVRPGDVFVARSSVHGHGVFAGRTFLPGEVIEDCPVLLLAADRVLELGLDGYCFEWTGDQVAVALGYGSLYNHSWHPNARYDHDYGAGVVTYSAVRHIRVGDEITINYSGDPDGRVELWFDGV
jgi:hypothetical protein